MIIEDVIGELLYIGIVAEKGRCYGIRWNGKYKRILKKHIFLLNGLLELISEEDVTKIESYINKFMYQCKNNEQIGKFYQFKVINNYKLTHGLCYTEINNMMKILFYDLMHEMKKMFVSKIKIYYLLCALHNLPRVYLGKNKDTLCCINQNVVTKEEAFEYTYQNMTVELRKKYFDILN